LHVSIIHHGGRKNGRREETKMGGGTSSKDLEALFLRSRRRTREHRGFDWVLEGAQERAKDWSFRAEKRQKNADL